MSQKGYDNAAYTTSVDDVKVVPESKLPVQTKQKDGTGTSWGFCSFKPKCLQGLNRMSLFTIFVCIMCFLEGYAVNGIANAALPSIERQFKVPSTKSAIIPSSQDIGALIVVLFISFIGGRYNKASWVATGSVIMAVGSFLFMVPHFAEKYIYPESTAQTSYNCSASSLPSELCQEGGEKYLAVFVVAQLVHGFGFTPMFTLGTAYIDENEDHQLAAVYIGLTYAATAIGVAAGFFLGGQFSQNYFVDFDRVNQDSLGFDATDVRWIGAWWIGFSISVIGFILIAVPIYGYPKFLPGTEKYRVQKPDIEEQTTAIQLLKLFLANAIDLFKNRTFMMLTFAGSSNTLIISGVGAFSFKFLMEQYNLNFDIAGYLIGGLILIGSVGMFLGGLIIRMFKLEVRGMLHLCAVTTLLSGVLGICFLAGCPETRLRGLEMPYTNNIDTSGGFLDTCQTSCTCKYEAMSLVCGGDNTVYYSPCHAGCKTQNGQLTLYVKQHLVTSHEICRRRNARTTLGMTDKWKIENVSYSNCSCVADALNISVYSSTATATMGRCDDGCDKLVILAPFMFLAMILVLTSVTPNSMAVMRVVPDEQRPFALGVQWVFIRLLGTIPGPFLVGWAIDNACLIFLEGSCGNKGNCLLYSHESMALGVMVWWLVVSLVSSIFYFLASIFQCCDYNKSFDLT